MKKTIAYILVLSMLMSIAGCEPLRRKFVRKKKAPVKMPRIYQVRKYEKRSPEELYKKHYVYWMTWQSELIEELGSNHKKDVRCIEEIIGNLKDMRYLLVEDAASAITPHIDKLMTARDVIIKDELTQYNRDYIRRTLEKESRAIRRGFSFGKVKGRFKPNAEEPGGE